MEMPASEALPVAGSSDPRTLTALLLESIPQRHQIAVLERSRTRRPCFRVSDRLFWILFSRWWPQWRDSLIIVQPDTVLRWRRDGWSALWRYRARGRWRGGRPRVASEVRQLIAQMVREIFLWGAPRIHGELQMLGFGVSEATVSRYMPARSRRPECLLKIPSEPKLERVRHSMSFGCDQTEPVSLEIDPDCDTNMMEQASIKNCVGDGATVAATEINGQCDESRREALVTVVRTTDLRDGDDSADPRRLDGARVRTILVERKMRPGAVVIIHVGREDAAQMALVEDDDMVQAFPPDRTDDPLDVGVLPRRAWRRDDLGDPQRLNLVANLEAIRGIAVAQQVARRTVPRERFGHLV